MVRLVESGCSCNGINHFVWRDVFFNVLSRWFGQNIFFIELHIYSFCLMRNINSQYIETQKCMSKNSTRPWLWSLVNS